jgi:hypothetical protein
MSLQRAIDGQSTKPRFPSKPTALGKRSSVDLRNVLQGDVLAGLAEKSLAAASQ